MAWIEITEADVLTVLSGPELEGYRAVALKAGQVDPVGPTIAQVTDLVRGYVGGCKQNTLGEGATIPQKLLAPALDILAVRIPKRVGRDPKPGRQSAHDEAVKLLEMVSRCMFDIEEPETPTDETSSGQSPASEGKTLTHTREDQDGI